MAIRQRSTPVLYSARHHPWFVCRGYNRAVRWPSLSCVVWPFTIGDEGDTVTALTSGRSGSPGALKNPKACALRELRQMEWEVALCRPVRAGVATTEG